MCDSACYVDIRPEGSVVSQRQLLVGYGMFRARGECVCVSSFGEGLAVWVLPPREDRGRRADRIGLVLLNWYKSVHVVQPPRSRPPGSS